MFCKKQAQRHIIAGIAVMIVMSCLLSCKKKEEAPAPLAETSTPAAPAAAPESRAKDKNVAAPQEKTRKVIVNHSIDLEVKDFSVALEALTTLAESSGGYVVKSNNSSPGNGSREGQVSIRVPTGISSGVLKRIRGFGRVENESSSAEDITEEYIDLEARMKNAKASEARLLELYRRAGKVEDMLSIEEEVSRVRGEIEAFEAKKKNWDILTELVTIDITLHEPSGGFPSFQRLWYPIKSAFGTAAQFFVDSLHALIVFIGAILPWLVILGPLAYLLIRRQRKKRNTSVLDSQIGESSQDKQDGV